MLNSLISRLRLDIPSFRAFFTESREAILDLSFNSAPMATMFAVLGDPACSASSLAAMGTHRMSCRFGTDVMSDEL